MGKLPLRSSWADRKGPIVLLHGRASGTSKFHATLPLTIPYDHFQLLNCHQYPLIHLNRHPLAFRRYRCSKYPLPTPYPADFVGTTDSPLIRCFIKRLVAAGRGMLSWLRTTEWMTLAYRRVCAQ